MLNLTPIASPEAEAALLSGILIDAADGLAICSEAGISARSFSLPANATLFAEIQAMHAADEHIDAATVEQRFRSRMDAIGGWQNFLAITTASPTTAQVGFYADEVAAFAYRREVHRHALALAETCHADPDAIPAMLTRLQSAASAHATNPESKWPVVVSGAVAHAEQLIARTPQAAETTLTWPWPAFTRAFQPVARGELVVIAARPSVGKSSLTRAICLFHATAGKQVLFNSIEDSPRSVAFQAAAAGSGVSFTGLVSAHAAEQAEYLTSLRALSMPNLHVFSRDNSLASLLSRAKAIHAKTPLDLLAVDQLSHVTDCEPTKHETKASAVGRVTRALKRLAMDLNCPILLLCQLSRQSVNDHNREPRLTDLRDSGEIEQDADRVILLHRPDVDPNTNTNQAANDDAEDRPTFFVNAIQAKGRSVGSGQVVSMYFKRKTATFNPIKHP